MKTSLILLTIVSTFLLVPLSGTTSKSNATDILGAWQLASVNGQAGEYTASLLIEDGYLFYTEYDVSSKHFEGSMGGQFKLDGNDLDYTIEFDTWKPERIGEVINAEISLDDKRLTVTQTLSGEEATMVFTQVDNGTGDLAGAWRITDRMRNGTMQAMRPGPRKTIKMITGSRFQWAAFNPETKKFSGTGGGRVTLKDGKYTEHIEFFSRNADRVGANLTFDYKVDGIKWDHSGTSSSGNPIREIWTRQNQ